MEAPLGGSPGTVLWFGLPVRPRFGPHRIVSGARQTKLPSQLDPAPAVQP